MKTIVKNAVNEILKDGNKKTVSFSRKKLSWNKGESSSNYEPKIEGIDNMNLNYLQKYHSNDSEKCKCTVWVFHKAQKLGMT